MNNACPSCGAVYNVSAKDVGRKLKCKKCGTSIQISEFGIEADAAAAPAAAPPTTRGSAVQPALPAPADDSFPEPAPAPRPAGRAGRARGGFDPFAIVTKVGGISTLIFGFGAFLVIFNMFQPIIGDAKVKMRQAAVDEDKMNYDAEVERINKDDSIKAPDKSKKLDDLRKESEKDSKKSLEGVKSADISNKKSGYLDRYFMMFGFLLVMAGSLAFMMPEQPSIKRVVGAIVITSQMVFVFLFFLARSVASG